MFTKLNKVYKNNIFFGKNEGVFLILSMPDIYLPLPSLPRHARRSLLPVVSFGFQTLVFAGFLRVSLLPSLANQPSFPLLSYPSVVACSPRPGHVSGMVIPPPHCRLVCLSSFDFSDAGGKCFLSCAVRSTTQRVRFHLSNFKKSPKMPPKIPPAKALQFVFKGSIIVI